MSYTAVIDRFAKDLQGEEPDTQMRADILHANGRWYRLMMRPLTEEEIAEAERQRKAGTPL